MRYRHSKCKCALETDEFHGWECELTGGECAFLSPSSKLCAEVYGEGPDSDNIAQCGEQENQV